MTDELGTTRDLAVLQAVAAAGKTTNANEVIRATGLDRETVLRSLWDLDESSYITGKFLKGDDHPLDADGLRLLERGRRELRKSLAVGAPTVTQVTQLEPEEWGTIVGRVASVPGPLTWAYVALRDGSRLVPIALRVEYPDRGKTAHYDYSEVIIAMEVINADDAAERLRQGALNPTSGVGLLPPASRTGPKYTPFAVPSDNDYGIGPPKDWPLIHIGASMEAVPQKWSLVHSQPLSAPGVRPFPRGDDAVREIVYGLPPGGTSAYQINPEITIRIADMRARLRDLVVDDDRVSILVDRGTTGVMDGWKLWWTIRYAGAWSTTEHEQPLDGPGEQVVATPGAAEHIYLVLYDEVGAVVDQIEFDRNRAALAAQLDAMRIRPSTGPLGTLKYAADEPAAAELEPEGDPRTVMVVVGRDLRANDALFTFLRSLGLNPQLWGQLVSKAGQGSPEISHVLRVAFSSARAFVVLLTGDDEAQLRAELRGKNEKPHEITLTPQPRQNVLFEAGMAIGYREARTIILEHGPRRPFSDIEGRHTVRTSDRQWRNELANRLETAGCVVDRTGDWLTAGRFPSSRPRSPSNSKAPAPSA